MGRLVRRRRLCCSITEALPARHREQAGKNLTFGDPKFGLGALGKLPLADPFVRLVECRSVSFSHQRFGSVGFLKQHSWHLSTNDHLARVGGIFSGHARARRETAL